MQRITSTQRMADELLKCVVEIPKGSRNKYEYDPELGAIKLDRFISASVVYPTDYGFVPGTLAPDGDPLDVLVCVSEPTFPGCVVMSKLVALFKMSDEKGRDDHVVCVPHHDPGWNYMNDVEDLPELVRAEIGHFFAIYKDLDPDRHSEVMGWGDRAEALVTLDEARRRVGTRSI
ncbi:MAG TPA: inorganic diphosphatase [Solirubrobacteraceae bacterium]|jgi:inorganic pyrophosphatase